MADDHATISARESEPGRVACGLGVMADERSGAVLAPVTAGRRIETLDVLRGVAVLGILMMNIPGFAMAFEGAADPFEAAGSAIWDQITFIGSEVLFEGTMRGLFSLLFGAGVVLLTSRIEERAGTSESRRIYYRRNIWLIVFGLVHAYLLLWVGDILFVYGVVALVLYPLRNLRPRTLIAIGVAVLALQLISAFLEHRGTLQQHANFVEAERLIAVGQPVPPELSDARDEWLKSPHGNPEETAGEIQVMRSGYITILREAAPKNFESQTVEMIKWNLWDAGGMMLIGMGLMKLGVLSGLRTRRFYARMMVVGYAIGIAVNSAEAWVFLQSYLRNDPLLEPYAWYTYDLARVPMTLGHVGLIVLLVQSGRLVRLLTALATVGRMALTNYIGQTVICSLLFYGFGFGLFARLSHSEVMLVMVGIWLVQIMFSVAWLRRFRYGPLEWLWRSLTYMKMQPMGPDGGARLPVAT
jgi:uncharacterized protein